VTFGFLESNDIDIQTSSDPMGRGALPPVLTLKGSLGQVGQNNIPSENDLRRTMRENNIVLPLPLTPSNVVGGENMNIAGKDFYR